MKKSMLLSVGADGIRDLGIDREKREKSAVGGSAPLQHGKQ